jgi:hypothetical protein
MTKRRGVQAALLWAICLYGALLRFEAFHQPYSPLEGSAPLIKAPVTIADLASRVRPVSLAWPRADMPYRFDAKSYLDSAPAGNHHDAWSCCSP